ncbi:Pre-mRNA-splicing factor CWC25 like protein [Verticillium longisporum]|uniref:Pre-mRNA-splicing factor CWC25 like protein n=1 Tax=Verticillium longisporum TaxID=100787 RepID=A0A8I2Z8Q3_VERLO|nr:Pre-mRNA-splicing factor CWC25 like protein [Verticillium longisporum]
MGGDLNLKKSFHPGLLKNQAKVWEEEKKALDERKKTQQRINELKEERAREEIQKQLEAAGHTKKIDRVDFLYNGPTNGQTGTTEEMEGYLLGKRRIDNLITGSDHKKLEKQAGQESFMALQTANTARDTAAKVREDPMLAIKKQEQAAYEAMMNDPIRRRQLLANMGISDETKDRSKRREDKHRKRRHRHRDEDSDDERRHRHRRRAHSRSQSPSWHRRDGSDEGNDRRRSSRRDSPKRRRYDSDEDVDRRRERRSRSPRRREREDRDSHQERGDRRDDRRRDGDRRDSRRDERHDRQDDRGRDGDRERSYDRPRRHSDRSPQDQHRRRFDGGRRNGGFAQGGGGARDNKADEEEKARKLAAMQSAASELDSSREQRLATLAQQEKAARDADDEARQRASKHGGENEFSNRLHRKAGDLGLAERMGRGREGYHRDDD